MYPASIGIKTVSAQLLYKQIPPVLNIETEKNGYTMESHPIRMELDNEEFFNDIGIKSQACQRRETIAAGKRAVQEFMARQAREKNAMQGPNGLSPAEIAAQPEAMKLAQLVFIPAHSPKVSWSGGDVDIEYTPDEVVINWTKGDLNFRYVPYQVEISVDKWSRRGYV
ncbi:MAG: DUF6470 family protein [Clostridiaceae bacterium]|nr:DUF6470 family protein [Clostridiaceae bacterium]